ncbi:MAG: class A beta-lactamase-related serine hydrolase [Chloroflexota bacterium]|nr:class A beta-lactamase-related serine hydrolase [Chloroflexota bacterium]
MQAEIEQALKSLGGRYACVVMCVDQGVLEELVSLNSDMVFPAASLVKVPILLEVTRQVARGWLSWETRYTVPASARVPSAGVLADLSPDLRPTLHDLAHLMITISDNTAANMLLDLVSMEAVNATMQALGLNSTRLERRFMDFEARHAGRDNWTTAGDMARLYSLFLADTLPGTQEMLAILLRQNDYTILPAYWGEEVPFAHKTGGLVGVMHDAGILYPPTAPDSPLIIVALTAEQTDEPLTRLTLATVGRMLFA